MDFIQSHEDNGGSKPIKKYYNYGCKYLMPHKLVSRLLPAKRGCGRAVIFIISYDTMNTFTADKTSFKSGDSSANDARSAIMNVQAVTQVRSGRK